MKRAVLITSTDYYDVRFGALEESLHAAGYETTLLISDFNHFTKTHRQVLRAGTETIYTIGYQKNLSLRRILSHLLFSRRAMHRAAALAPALLYVLLPPNSLAGRARKYARKHGCKLYFDLYDMWPESFPGAGARCLRVPFHWWRNMRDKNLAAADTLVVECDLYRTQIANEGVRTRTLYLTAAEVPVRTAQIDPERFEVAYLGHVNHIIDIAGIAAVLGCVAKKMPVVLHVVGRGERMDDFVNAVQAVGATVIRHGVIYDPAALAEIFCRCRFGISMMKKQVCVGLTMKSLDYFRFSLPVLNTIPADSSWLIQRYGAGINATDDPCETAQRLLAADAAALAKMRAGARQLFQEQFSHAAAMRAIADIFS